MTGTANSAEGVLLDFLMTILPKIVGEPTRESIINIHRLISENAAYVAPNLGGGRHVYLVLTITTENYLAQTGYTVVPIHNPRDYPPEMETSKEQALGTKRL